jgi:NAD(P)-dependent dehydrogenase (short-subunit alcohol dehydrogenase family)
MIRQGGGGAIVNVTSVSAQIPARGAAAYATAKAGMEMLTRVAALELSAHAIRVNALSPGLVATPLTAPMLSIPGVQEAYNERIPLGAAAQPSEIAAPALFLGSSEASYITGASLVADGDGLTRYPDLRRFSNPRADGKRRLGSS